MKISSDEWSVLLSRVSVWPGETVICPAFTGDEQSMAIADSDKGQTFITIHILHLWREFNKSRPGSRTDFGQKKALKDERHV